MKTKTLILSIISVALLSCSGNSSNTANSNQSEPEVSVATKQQTKWVYTSDKNEMDDTETFYAQIEANDKLSFDFPYGEETASLIIRNMSNNNEVLLSITNGQFLSNLMGDRFIKVRFDEDNAKNISYLDPSDGSTTVIFINEPDKFIARLKTAKRLLIESEFFNEGNRTMKFDTQGFSWDH